MKKSKKKGLGFAGQAQNGTVSKERMKEVLKGFGIDMASGLAGVLAASVTGPVAGALVATGLLLVNNSSGQKNVYLSKAAIGMLSYSIAKAAYDGMSTGKSTTSPSEDNVKNRLTSLKNEVLKAFFIDRLLNRGKTTETIQGFEGMEELQGALSADDLSALDMFERFNESEAAEFSQKQMKGADEFSDTPLEFAYTFIDENQNQDD